MVWSLLLVAPRAVVELQRSRRRRSRSPSGSDADQLAGLTRLPAGLWIGIFWLMSVACLLGGGWLLLSGAGCTYSVGLQPTINDVPSADDAHAHSKDGCDRVERIPTDGINDRELKEHLAEKLPED